MSREIYESGGWCDGRLGMAYDLIDQALNRADLGDLLKQILIAIEKADIQLRQNERTE